MSKSDIESGMFGAFFAKTLLALGFVLSILLSLPAAAMGYGVLEEGGILMLCGLGLASTPMVIWALAALVSAALLKLRMSMQACVVSAAFIAASPFVLGVMMFG